MASVICNTWPLKTTKINNLKKEKNYITVWTNGPSLPQKRPALTENIRPTAFTNKVLNFNRSG